MKMKWIAVLILAAIVVACIPDGVQEAEGSISAERLRNAAVRKELLDLGLITFAEFESMQEFEMVLLRKERDWLMEWYEEEYLAYREAIAERLNAMEEVFW